MANHRMNGPPFCAAYRAIVDAWCAGRIAWIEYEHRAGALLQHVDLPPRKRDRRNILNMTEDQLINRIRRREKEKRYYERKKRSLAQHPEVTT